MLKACRKENHNEELATTVKLYSADILMADLRIQLQTWSTNLNCDDSVSLHDVVKYLQEVPKVAQSLCAEVITLVKLILVMPVTNSTSERFFSSLRRVKTYLRSTMTQCQQIYLMVLRVHKD